MISYQYTINSPIGPLTLVETDNFISAIYIQNKEKQERTELSPDFCPVKKTPLLCQTSDELSEYFQGKRKVFSLPLNPSGTPFQKRCWEALLTIPYGKPVLIRILPSQSAMKKPAGLSAWQITGILFPSSSPATG